MGSITGPTEAKLQVRGWCQNPFFRWRSQYLGRGIRAPPSCGRDPPGNLLYGRMRTSLRPNGRRAQVTRNFFVPPFEHVPTAFTWWIPCEASDGTSNVNLILPLWLEWSVPSSVLSQYIVTSS